MDLKVDIDEWGPEKVVCVSDRKTGMRGVLVIDNTARGMAKGGTRMSESVTVDEVRRLARAMTWKWAAADLFFGGAKAGVLGNPNGAEKESVLRAFARCLKNEVPSEYVFGLDMGLSENDAAIFMDELGSRDAAVGLPSELGGLPYDEIGVTGYGVAEAARAASCAVGMNLAVSRVVIQGFGAVGEAAAKRFAGLGTTIVGVSTTAGAVLDQNGIDVEKLSNLRRTFGDDCVIEYGGVVPAEEALLVDTDVLVPAACEDVIDEEVARKVCARLVVEGANFPTTAPGLDLLSRRGIEVVPDFIANAGGIIAAAHSMAARSSPFRVDPGNVLDMITSKIHSNVIAVREESAKCGIGRHDAARQVTEKRVQSAMKLRGQLVFEEM